MLQPESIQILPSVLNIEECSILNKWVLDNFDTDIFQEGRAANARRTTRFTKNVNYEYPKLITDTFYKVRQELGVLDYENISQGKDGIICAISFNESKLETHVDPKYDDTESLHLVIKTSSGESGGDLIINDVVYKLNEGDCLCFFASVHEHYTNALKSTTPRIVWINGIKVKV